ncbi:MAG: hypothetical protein HY235_23070 [Acidobacteria bacterium]|nr:hypothetical protein [Acidobacteriota bacterium]
MTKTALRRIVFAALSLCSLAAVATIAYATHSWNGYHWARTSNPFTLKLGDNVSTAWDSILNTTSIDWSASAVLDTNIVPGQANPRNCRPTSGRVEVCNSPYGNTGWLGVAQVWVSGQHITQATVKLNDTYFNTSTYNTPAWRNLVSCQEVGHTLGLDHQDTNFNNANLATCMDYTSDPSTNQHPNQHDYQELELIYAHLDSTTTIGSATASQLHPPAMNELDLSGPAQWGKLLKESNSGRAQTYVLDFGGDHKVFTFVIWAMGAERGRAQ